MESKLKELKNKILFGDYSDEQWKKMNEEITIEFGRATDREKEEFLDSGAGDLLAQIMEYMD